MPRTEAQKRYLKAHPGYRKEVDRRRRERNRAFLSELRQQPCADCGLADPVVMEFDHVPERGEKALNVSNLVGAPKAKLLREIAKCDVVCANCHRRRTAARLVGAVSL